jgi:hypothetical protein
MSKETFRPPKTLKERYGLETPLTYNEIINLSKLYSEDEEFNSWLEKAQKKNEFVTSVEVTKVQEDLGIVMGFAIVCKEDGEEYFDTQGDHIPEDAMLKASADFMKHSRMADDMHDENPIGDVVFAFPLTDDIAKAFDITTKKTGLIIGIKPSEEILNKFKSGEYRGFSIGGYYGETEYV